MKKAKKALFLGLIMILGVTACSTEQQPEKEKSTIKGYVEKEMPIDSEGGRMGKFYETPEGIMQFYLLEDQRIDCYEESDGKWMKKSFTGEEAVDGLKADVLSTLSAQGEDWLYLIYLKEADRILEDGHKAFDSYFAEIKGGKVIRNVKLLVESKLGWVQPDDLIRLDDERLLLLNAYEKPTCYDMHSGKLLDSWNCYGVNGTVSQEKITVYDNGGFEFSHRGPSIADYDRMTGEKIDVIETPRIDNKSGFTMDGKGALYVASPYCGISRLTAGGTVWEELVAKGKTSLSIPNMVVKDMYISTHDECYLLLYNDQMSHPISIKKYVYGEVIADKDRQPITVYALHENDTVKQALIAYGMKHPELNINFEVGETDDQTAEDQINSLNTQLLAGEGPDLIVLDGLPIASYVKQGALEDLSELEGRQALFPFIQKAAAYEQKVYAYPTRLFFPMMWERGKMVNNVNSLSTLATYKKNHPTEGVTPDYNVEIMLQTFYPAYQETLIDDKGNINETHLRQFFEDLKTIMGTGEYAAELETNETTLKKRGCYRSFMGYYNEGTWNMYTTVPKDVEAILSPLISNDISGGHDYSFLEDANNCEAVGVLGVNVNSKHKEVANDIISYCLSCDVQSIDTSEGFPVNQEVCKSWLDGTGISKKSLESSFYADKDTIVVIKWSHEKELGEIYDHMTKLDHAVIVDETLKELIQEQLQGYLSGEKTVDEAVKEVKDRMIF